MNDGAVTTLNRPNDVPSRATLAAHERRGR